MKFSFIIISAATVNDIRPTNDCVFSIEDIVPEENREIIVVGNFAPQYTQDWEAKIIHFDESVKPKWITRKKNIGALHATGDWIVFMHDYFQLDYGWWDAWKNFNFAQSCSKLYTNKIHTKEGPRHSDWALCPYDMWEDFPELKDNYDVGLNYGTRGFESRQYLSGGYWLSERKFALENPQLEQYGWGDAEDVHWSRLVRQKTTFGFNPNAAVSLTKPGKWQMKQVSPFYLDKIQKKYNLDIYFEDDEN